jgi:hypothetical protein
MNHPVPAHRENSETLALEPAQFFEAENSVSTPGQRARVRPPDRPRAVPALGTDADDVQLFDREADPVPPGTKAEPQPKGPEHPLGPENGAVT